MELIRGGTEARFVGTNQRILPRNVRGDIYDATFVGFAETLLFFFAHAE